MASAAIAGRLWCGRLIAEHRSNNQIFFGPHRCQQLVSFGPLVGDGCCLLVRLNDRSVVINRRFVLPLVCSPLNQYPIDLCQGRKRLTVWRHPGRFILRPSFPYLGVIKRAEKIEQRIR